MARDWKYLDFVYETEDTLAANRGPSANVPPIDPLTLTPLTITGGSNLTIYGPVPPDFTQLTTTTPPGGSPGTEPITPLNTEGKTQEKILNLGTNIVDPCWLMNTFTGMQGWMEDGVRKFYTGEIPLMRGPVASVRTRAGWGWHGDGISPDSYQGYTMESINADGNVMCQVMGWSGPRCRVPGAAFPLDVLECTGEAIGGDASAVGNNPPETMWQRFEDTCLRPQYPECGPVETP